MNFLSKQPRIKLMSRLLIQFSHLTKSFGSCLLFDDISLSINQGDIFALIGQNGIGKTTLLHLLAGTVLADAGHFSEAPHLCIGLLPQEVSLPATEISVRAYVEEGSLSEFEQQMTACLDDPDRLTEWSELHEQYEQLGGYRRIPAEKILSGLKLDLALLDLPMASLSSGQRVGCSSVKERKREYIGTVKLAVYQNANCAHLRHFIVAFSIDCVKFA